MRKVFYKGRFIFIPLAVAACLAAVSFVVMQLWNCLLPGILHVGTVTFWQAMGIFILCKILFGFGGKGRRGCGPGGGGAPWMRRKMEEKFKNMSTEERERFKQKMGDMCGPRGRWGRYDWSQHEAEPTKPTEE